MIARSRTFMVPRSHSNQKRICCAPHDIPPGHRASDCTTAHPPGSGVRTLAPSPTSRVPVLVPVLRPGPTWQRSHRCRQCARYAVSSQSSPRCTTVDVSLSAPSSDSAAMLRICIWFAAAIKRNPRSQRCQRFPTSGRDRLKAAQLMEFIQRTAHRLPLETQKSRQFLIREQRVCQQQA